MIVVAMGENTRLGCGDSLDCGSVPCEVGLAQAGRAGKSANIQTGPGLDAPELEISEPGVKSGVGVQRDPARL